MDKIKKQDDSVMKALDVKVIRRLICNTDKGPLDLVIRKGESNYFLMLDSTPLDKETNDKLMNILFKPEIPQVKKENILVPVELEDVTSQVVKNTKLTKKVAINGKEVK